MNTPPQGKHPRVVNLREGSKMAEIDLLVNVKQLASKANLGVVSTYLDSCSPSVLSSIKGRLHTLIALQGHPSRAYEAGVRAQTIKSIFEEVYSYKVSDYSQMLILELVGSLVRKSGSINEAGGRLRVLCALWDATLVDDPDGDLEKIIEDQDWHWLELTYGGKAVSDEAIENVAGRAISYKETGSMHWYEPAEYTRKFFGWEK